MPDSDAYNQEHPPDSILRLYPAAMHRYTLLAAIVAIASGPSSARCDGQESSPAKRSSVKAAEFFETRVRPLLVERCMDCHNEDAPESDLRLDSLQALLDGGLRGPAIVPGDAKNSLLFHAVSHSEADLQMPEGEKLSAEEIRWLSKWIDEGAFWPGESAEVREAIADNDGPLFSQEDKSFWAFVPPVLPPLPKVNDAAWVKAELDHFILAKLEASQLKPSPPAEKRTLIRRAYFDLIGLPPSPEQVAAFLLDESPNAFDRVVDELLASPRYGERWGRHWLDVARYADSNGLDENWAFEFIYKYRDWVIEAFNRDLPFTDFVRYQLAGDLIEQSPGECRADTMQRVAAAGFLSLGPKMIADDDPQKKKMDIIDEQLNVVSQAFMALTVGCARCHDHKFDPIPTWDYYAMAGIFKSTKTMEHLRVVAPVALHEFEYDGYSQDIQAYEDRLVQLERERNAFWMEFAKPAYDSEQEDSQATDAGSDDAFQLPKHPEKWVPKDRQDEWQKLVATIDQHQATKPEKIKVMAPTEGEPEDLRVSIRGNYLTLGEPTRRQFLRIITGEQPQPLQTTQSGRLELAQWLTDETHPLTARVIVNRIWRWRFGRGLVATTDNFGKLGERPTHPELLDWLAVKFMQDGWSIKKLHKRMLLSSTYQMSSQTDPLAIEIDPENKLWSRFSRKRLEAEAIRDSILCVSHGLDLAMYGSLMDLKDRAYVTGTASKTQDYGNPRRSVYQPVFRSAVYDVFTAFDFPDPATPNGDRHDSVVAPQALMMMNSTLVADSAARLAMKLIDEFETDEMRVAALFQRTLSRPPDDQEVEQVLGYLTAVQADLEDSGESQACEKTWQSICRTLISSNEFLYLD